MEVAQVGASLGNAAAGVIGAIGNLIPSVGAKGATGSNNVDFIAPSNNFTDARAKGEDSIESQVFAAGRKIGTEAKLQ
jgi:hypothetical protein